MALKQDNRFLNLKTPLGDNELLLTQLRGEEGVSQLFRFHLEMLSDNNSIAAKDIVGKGVTFSVRLADDSLRHFNGIVSRFFAGDEDENGRRSYRAEIVPWLWFLTRNADCRVFQEMTAPDIIEQIFQDRGFSDFQIKATGSHAKRDYCVQHTETDFNFVSRLMEEEGMFYFFEHSDGKHQLIIGDGATAYIDCGQKEVGYPTDFGSLALEDHIRSWEHAYEFRTGKVAQTDYNFETPSTDLGTNANTIVDLPGTDKFELYEYPGLYPDKGAGQPLTDVRMEEEEVAHDVVDGTSICRAFTPGGKFKIRQHRASTEEGKSFVITQVCHTAHELLAYETGAADSVGYENSFACIPDSVTYRPPRVTPKPRVQGVQTAVVTGPSGETIYPDEYGRVKVQFHWDRYGKKDEKSSCWVRVSQAWAGMGWGSVHIPHVGQEVIVAFEYGDIDRPIIVGRVYNAEQQIPLSLPDDKEKCIVLGHGGNKMLWNDKDGEQKMEMFSPTENSFFSIGEGCIHQHTDGNHVLRIQSDRDDQVDGNEQIAIGQSREEEIGANLTQRVAANRTEEVGGNRDTFIQGSEKVNVLGPINAKWDGVNALIHGGATSDNFLGVKHGTVIGANIATNFAANITLSGGLKYTASDAGEKKTSAFTEHKSKSSHSIESVAIFINGTGGTLIEGDSGKIDIGASKIVIDNGGGASITLKGNTIVLKAAGIKLDAPDITAEGYVLGKKGGSFG